MALDQIMFNVLWCFNWILEATEQEIKDLVDMYNQGQLPTNWCLALEAIDGCDGPGDAIVNTL